MNFRRWLTVLSVLVLFTGLASAQTPIVSSLVCQTGQGTVTPLLRGEGNTELVGDIVLTCTGGNALAAGTQIPQVNITVSLGAPVTSRLLAATTSPALPAGTGTLSEAVLFVDEPGTNSGPLAGYGPNAPQKVCPTPVSGCIAYAQDISGFKVPVSTPGTSPATQDVPNVYQGIVLGNQVTFNGVPVLPPATSGFARTFRITNIRIAANYLYNPASTVAVSASISTNPSTYLPIGTAQPIVGYVSKSLNGSASIGTTRTQCESPVKGQIAKLTFTEQFATAFKTRVAPVSGTVLGYGTTTAQNIPGSLYNSESGLTIAGLAGIASTSTTVAGLADFGTRLKATFVNVPVGISHLYVDPTPDGVTAPAAIGDTSTTGYAQLVTSEGAAAGSFVTATGPQEITIASDQTATAVWEVTNVNSSNLDSLSFNVYVTYTPDSANNRPTGTGQVILSYAPVVTGSAAAAASSTLSVPRFANVGINAGDIMKIIPCRTVLLWPYVTTFTGFNTGIAISNTSKDPGTDVISGGVKGATATAQGGTCDLYLYGAAEFGTAPTMPITTPRIEAGTTYSADLASLLGSSYSVSTGYLFGVCNFQYAHGYAAISDVHFDKFLSSYLALVVNGPGTNPATRGIAAENMNQ
jgi:hypothetical protein